MIWPWSTSGAHERAKCEGAPYSAYARGAKLISLCPYLECTSMVWVVRYIYTQAKYSQRITDCLYHRSTFQIRTWSEFELGSEMMFHEIRCSFSRLMCSCLRIPPRKGHLLRGTESALALPPPPQDDLTIFSTSLDSKGDSALGDFNEVRGLLYLRLTLSIAAFNIGTIQHQVLWSTIFVVFKNISKVLNLRLQNFATSCSNNMCTRFTN